MINTGTDRSLHREEHADKKGGGIFYVISLVFVKRDCEAYR